jgi:hypothetical protein
MPEPASADLWALSDLCTPWCIHVVATLRIANYLAGGITGVEQLAAAAGCDAGVLDSVLGRLVSKGVFASAAPGQYALNDVAQGLLDPALRLGLDLAGIGGRFAYAWGTLPNYVRTGQPAYHEVFGRPFWDDLDAHPEIAASFDSLMGPAGHGTPDPNFEITGGWDAVRLVVDVGGGTGAMLAEILRVRPALRGTLVDRPRTVALSPAVFEAAGVAERVTVVGQSFFDPLPAGADLYLLKKILNDWPDREALAILRRCAEAAGPAGRVVVIGGLRPDDLPSRLTIEMVLLGGKQRTISELRALVAEAGLQVVSAGSQPSGHLIVECRAAGE